MMKTKNNYGLRHTRIDRCYHEAGHVVLGLLLGVEIGSASVKKSGERGGRVVFKHAQYGTLLTYGVLEPSRAAMISLAGYVAQAAFRDRKFEYCWLKSGQWSFVDLPDVLDAIECYRDSPIWPSLLRACEKAAERLVARNWKAVEAVALLLYRKSYVRGAELTRVVMPLLKDEPIAQSDCDEMGST